MKKLLLTLALVISTLVSTIPVKADCVCESIYLVNAAPCGCNGLGLYFFNTTGGCSGYTPAFATSFPYFDVWSGQLFDYLWLPPGAQVTFQINGQNLTFGPYPKARAFHYEGPTGSSGNYTWSLWISRPAVWYQDPNGGYFPYYPDGVEYWTCGNPRTLQSPYVTALCHDTCL